MGKKEYYKYIEDLKTLNKWSDSYYNSDNVLASDNEYDTLYRKVKQYEESNPDNVHPLSLTHRVGHSVSDGFERYKHKARMYSQQDFFGINEVIDWYNDIESNHGEVTLIAEGKYDGLSLSVSYNKGKFVRAVTRGDGEVGDDVTNNARHITTIPMSIPFTWPIEIHGEVVMSDRVFRKSNEKRAKDGKKLFANPRNAAVGTIRSLDSKVMKERPLTFIAWSFAYGKPKNMNSLYKISTLLSTKLHFKMADGYIFTGKTNIQTMFDHYVEERKKSIYGLDGIVIKIDDCKLHDDIGYTSKFPKWSCALKFPPVEVTTKVIDIIDQVGRTGSITPVAILKPVLVDGSVVERSTLHNYSEVVNKDIRIGDEIIIIKSGDIIPKITHVFKERRDNTVVKKEPPTTCPTCRTGLVGTLIDLSCPNEECGSRMVRKLAHFVGRDYMDIESLGPSLLEKLVDKGKVKNPIDLYKLTPSDVYDTGGHTTNGSERIVEKIQKSKQVRLDKFLAALGIHNLGRSVSKQLVSKYGLKVFDLTREELLSEDGIGSEIADSFLNYLNSNKELISEFRKILTFTLPVESSGKLSNEVIVLTGSFPNGKHTVANRLTNEGATIVSSVGKKVTMVIYGESAGSKLEKANKLGIKTIPYNGIGDILK